MPQPSYDPTGLDWHLHLLRPEEAELGEGVFLADLAMMLGAAIYEGWEGDEPTWLKPEPHPEARILDPMYAFDADGNEKPDVHAAFAPAVRAVLSPALWRDFLLRRTDETAWLLSHVPDPRGGPPISSEALNARSGLDADDPITNDNWQAAWELVEMEREFRKASIERMTTVAKAIADLALSGEVKLRARPILGGRCDVEVPPSIWLSGTETRIRMLAACGFDPTAPSKQTAPATHLIFAESEGLDEAVARYGAANLICLMPPNEPWTVKEPDERQRRPRNPAIEDALEALFLAASGQPHFENWRGADLKAIVQQRYGTSNLDGTVINVRRKLLERPEMAHLAKSGQPPKTGRPSLMSHVELKSLVDALPVTGSIRV